MSKNLKIYNSALSVVGAAALAIAGGCAKPVSTSDPIYFNGVDNAKVADFYSIYVDEDDKYFVKKTDITSKISEYEVPTTLGIGVDYKGDAIVFEPEDVEAENELKNTSYITFTKEYDEKEEKTKVYMTGVQDAFPTKGYRIVIDGKTYDVSKGELVKAINESNVSLFSEGGSIGLGKGLYFESDEKGWEDKVYTKKPKKGN